MNRDSLLEKRPNLIAFGLIGATLIYIGLLLLSPAGVLPGDPVWAIQAETIQEILDESINFFFVLPLLNRFGMTVMEAPSVHPMTQALFNFAEAWIFMFLPLLLLDPRGGKIPRTLVWILAMFLTNVFLMPYMAARLFQVTPTADKEADNAVDNETDTLSKRLGWVGLLVGTLAIGWPALMQFEGGTLGEQWSYFVTQIASNRVTVAFCIDLVLFYLFQVWLMGAIIQPDQSFRGLRLIPFWGLSLWLIMKKPHKETQLNRA